MSAKERKPSPGPTQCDGSGPVRTPQVTSARGDWRVARLADLPHVCGEVSLAARCVNACAHLLGPATGVVVVLFTPENGVQVVQPGEPFDVSLDLKFHNISREAADAALTAALARLRGEL